MKIPHRHQDWEPRLVAHVETWRGREYAPAWGRDCVAFVLAGIEAVSGERLAFDGAAPYRSAAGQGRWLRQMGWRDLTAAADACLGARITPLQAHRGDVVTDGSILGLMMAGDAVAFGEEGLALMARHSIIAAWPVGRCHG